MSNGNYQETHERILKSGLAAFLEEGFEKANLRRICKAAGVTTGAFYKHFKDKEALFSELVEPLASMIRKAYAQGEKRGFAGYDEGKPVTPEQVRAAALDAISTLEGTLADPAPAVYLDNYGDSSINYLVQVWVPATNCLSMRYALNERIYDAFQRHGVEITYPHLNVHNIPAPKA